MQDWMVVYPKGDRSTLDIALVWSHERGQYDLASRRLFGQEEEAARYCRKLAKENGLKYVGAHAYLDEPDAHPDEPDAYLDEPKAA